MFNPQSNAVFIEQTLRNHYLATYGDADSIRKEPFKFLDGVLGTYEKQSKEKSEKAIIFWEKYEEEIKLNLSIDELGKERADILVEDVRELFR